MKEEHDAWSHLKCMGLALGGRRGQQRAQRRDKWTHGRKAKENITWRDQGVRFPGLADTCAA